MTGQPMIGEPHSFRFGGPAWTQRMKELAVQQVRAGCAAARKELKKREQDVRESDK